MSQITLMTGPTSRDRVWMDYVLLRVEYSWGNIFINYPIKFTLIKCVPAAGERCLFLSSLAGWRANPAKKELPRHTHAHLQSLLLRLPSLAHGLISAVHCFLILVTCYSHRWKCIDYYSGTVQTTRIHHIIYMHIYTAIQLFINSREAHWWGMHSE